MEKVLFALDQIGIYHHYKIIIIIASQNFRHTFIIRNNLWMSLEMKIVLACQSSSIVAVAKPVWLTKKLKIRLSGFRNKHSFKPWPNHPLDVNSPADAHKNMQLRKIPAMEIACCHYSLYQFEIRNRRLLEDLIEDLSGFPVINKEKYIMELKKMAIQN